MVGGFVGTPALRDRSSSSDWQRSAKAVPPFPAPEVLAVRPLLGHVCEDLQEEREQGVILGPVAPVPTEDAEIAVIPGNLIPVAHARAIFHGGSAPVLGL